MYPAKLVIARVARPERIDRDAAAQALDGAARREQPFRAFRVRIASPVLEKQGIVHDQHRTRVSVAYLFG